MSSTNRLLSLHILEILNKYSSAKRPMQQADLMYLLEKHYGERISRHTCSDYLKELRNEGYVGGGTVGVYRADLFTEREIRTLVDGVMYGKHIPEKDANVLISKLKELSLNTMQSKGNNITYLSSINRTENDNLYTILDKLDDAIETGHKVIIHQYSPNPDGTISEWSPQTVDPYFIVSDQSRYYLLCHTERSEGLEPRRIDRFLDVEVLTEKSVPSLDVMGADFELGTYMREHIYMFSGEVGKVTIRIKSKNIGYLHDWFGKKYFLVGSDDEFTTLIVKTNYNAAYFWALQYGGVAEVLEPKSLRSRIRDGLAEISKKYEQE